jgi:hypothetical protein
MTRIRAHDSRPGDTGDAHGGRRGRLAEPAAVLRARVAPTGPHEHAPVALLGVGDAAAGGVLKILLL